jgi:hypothetical protein
VIINKQNRFQSNSLPSGDILPSHPSHSACQICQWTCVLNHYYRCIEIQSQSYCDLQTKPAPCGQSSIIRTGSCLGMEDDLNADFIFTPQVRLRWRRLVRSSLPRRQVYQEKEKRSDFPVLTHTQIKTGIIPL